MADIQLDVLQWPHRPLSLWGQRQFADSKNIANRLLANGHLEAQGLPGGLLTFDLRENLAPQGAFNGIEDDFLGWD